MDFKDFKKKKDGKDHTIFEHKDGHELKVMHKAITKDQRKQIEGLPKAAVGNRNPKLEAAHGYAEGTPKGPIGEEGGETVENDLPLGESTTVPWNPEQLAKEQQTGIYDPMAINGPSQQLGGTPAGPVTQVNPFAQQAVAQNAGLEQEEAQEDIPQVTLGELAQSKAYNAGEQIPSLLRQAANATGKQAGIQEQAAKDLEAQNDAKNIYVQEQKTIKQDLGNLEKAIREGKVDPNHFYSSMSPGQRVANVIGLLLGSLGGHNSLAIKMLDEEVDRDIKEQQRVLGTKKTLYEANLQKYKNSVAAQALTKANILQAEALRVQAMGSRATSAQQKAQSAQVEMLINDKRAQQEAIATQALAQQKLINRIDSGSSPDTTAQDLNLLEQFDPKKAQERRSRYAPGVGIVASKKGAEELMSLKTDVDTAVNGIQELQKLGRNPLNRLNPIAKGKAKVIALTLQGVLRNPLLGPGTVTDPERKLMEKVIADPTALFSLTPVDQVKLMELGKRLQTNFTMAARARGAHNYQNPADIQHLPPKIK